MNSDEVVRSDKKFRLFAFSASLYGGASIIGPILLLGGGGYLLDKKLGEGHLFFIVGMSLAFIITNVLLYRKVADIVRQMSKIAPAVDGDKNKEDLKESGNL